MPERQAKKNKAYRALTMTATVMPRSKGPHYRASQEEMCEMFDVSDRTLRTWADIGLPRETDARGRPVYPFPDANIWAMCYRLKVRMSTKGRGPRHLTVEEADTWHLASQYRAPPRTSSSCRCTGTTRCARRCSG